MGQIDVEFSLALHNRTGKYFIGRDLVTRERSRIGEVRYWRFSREQVPEGLEAKALGRGLALEMDLRGRSRGLDRLLPRLSSRRPVLHLDPFSVLIYAVRACDAVLCHDLGPLTHASLFSQNVCDLYIRAYGEIAKARPHVVFVSQATQAAFHSLWGDDFASSRVIYPAVRTDIKSEDDLSPAHGIAEPFLLCVGNVGTRKNQLRAIHAFARSGLDERGVQFVICGGREPGYDAVAEAAATSGVRLLGYVDTSTLSWLYGRASGFVLPSLLEGFGIPVAEAIFRGLVPVVSRDSVLEEVAGDGALTVDSTSEAEIADAMRHLIDMAPDERKARLERLVRSANRFSLEAFYGQWEDLITQVTTGAGAG